MADRAKALVVTFDRFPASILGCYGNEWIETPHVNRLAAQGTVADQCWGACVGPATGEEAFSATRCLTAVRQGSGGTLLLQEAGAQIDWSQSGFDKMRTVAGEQGPNAKPDRVPLARLVQAAREAWRESPDCRLTWLHACGIAIPATPPSGFAELYVDEFEDRGVRLAELPDAERSFHPSVAAGMASLLDHWLGELFALVADEERADPTLIMVGGAQGSPWQRLPNAFGNLDELRSQSAHVPLIAACRGESSRVVSEGLRSARLLSTADVGLLVEWWFNGESASIEAELLRLSSRRAGGVITRGTGGATRVTTAEWSAIFSSGAELLFRKPEDYWEVNNLAAIEPGTLDALRHDASAKRW
jgi:hypothetical protein